MASTNKLTKETVLESICKASRTDTLGLFIGSGFAKAILKGNRRFSAYSWAELLKAVADEMKIERKVLEEGKPYPEVATILCQEYSRKKSISYKDAERLLKFKIAELVNISPDENRVKEYETVFRRLSPNWIITTNYDSIIEQILREKAFPITPRDSYIKTRDFTPVYHIHGSIIDPESIVITNDDYTHTLRISDYRHARLPFLIKESTVLMIGYSMNDLNVMSAVDYSKNVYSNDVMYDTPIVQLLYKQYANDDPYYSENGIIIQEISDLSDYFAEYLEYSKRYRGQIGKITKQVNLLAEKFATSEESFVSSFINDNNTRKDIIKQVSLLDKEFWYVYSGYTAFLNKCFGLLWSRASAPLAFNEYNAILSVLLDIIINVDYSNVPASFVDYLVEKFCSIAPYIGDDLGQSFSANRTWQNAKHSIPDEFFAEFSKRKSISNTYRIAQNLIDTK